MRTVALISGGKDSCYNMMQCVSEGHEIVALANLKPENKDELDSYMFQTVGHHAIDLYAKAMHLPLYRAVIRGHSIEIGADYTFTKNDEVEDLYQLLKEIKEDLDIDAVSVGAILSDYQRVRVEHVCNRLGLTVLAYLWRRDQTELLQEMISCGVEAVLIKVAALGLDPEKHLGKTLAEIQQHMLVMKDKFGLNVCGEGGEYETFTVDCPLFSERIIIDKQESVLHSDDAFAPVAYLNFLEMHTEKKNIPPGTSMCDRVMNLPMKKGCDIQDTFLFGEAPLITHVVREKCFNCKIKASKGPRIRIHRGKFLSISGVSAKISEDIEFSISQAMENLQGILLDNSCSFTNVIAVYLYVRDMANFRIINNVYKKYVSLNPPVRVCVEISLPENILLLLDCVGLVATDQRVDTLHVQGLSHWAPANIGPYSQAKRTGSLVHVAGQIGLRPSDLSIIPGGVVMETRLSLQHVDRILAVVTKNSGLHDVVSAVCYVTCSEDISVVKGQLEKSREIQAYDGLSSPFHVVYVVVPTLPHGALVEWQVYAVSEWHADWQEWHTVILEEDLTSHIFLAQSHQEETIATFSIAIETDSSPCKNYDVMSIFIRCLLMIMERLCNDWSNIRTLRLFYKAAELDMDLLNEGFDVLISEVVPEKNIPTISFIPVIAFENPNRILTVYH